MRFDAICKQCCAELGCYNNCSTPV